MTSSSKSNRENAERALAILPEQDSWALARRLAEGELDCCDAHMAHLGSPPPVMVWNPAPDSIEIKVLSFLAQWWAQAVVETGAPPTREMVDPLVLRPALGIISLLDVLDGGRDFRMRLHGSEISQTLDMDMTGMNLGEMRVPFMSFLLITYRAQVLRAEPLLLRYTPPMEQFLSAWWRIGLPLQHNGQVVRLLIGMHRAPRQRY